MIRWLLPLVLIATLLSAPACTMFGAAYDDLQLQGYHARALGADGAMFSIIEDPATVFAALEATLTEEGRVIESTPGAQRIVGTTESARIYAQVFPREDGGSRTEVRAEPLAGYTPRGEDALAFARAALRRIAAP